MAYWPSTLPGLTKTWSVYKMLSESVYIGIHLIVTCLRVFGPFQREVVLSMDFMGTLWTYEAITTQNCNSDMIYSTLKCTKEGFDRFISRFILTRHIPVNGPCKSRYLAKNVMCSTVLSFNIRLYYCIAIFPRLYPNTTYMPNTDYTDNTVVFIIWTDNVNAICATTISSHIKLWYCFAVFPRLYPPNTYLPNTDYTGYRVVFYHLHR